MFNSGPQNLFSVLCITHKHKAMSLLNVMVFIMLAVMIMSQVFFYSVNSSESVIEGREIMRVRLILEDAIRQAKSHTSSASPKGAINYTQFMDTCYSLSPLPSGVTGVDVHNLDYQFVNVSGGFDLQKWNNIKVYRRIFDQMPGAYLIRAYAPVTKEKSLMIQAIVESDAIKTWQEVWY